MIYYNFQDVKQIDFDSVLTSKWIKAVLKGYRGIEKEISYIFCTDEYILGINKEYLQHDYYTDIITFDYCENNLISGDLFISLDTVLSNSQEYNTTFTDELNRVIIHGILHLLGYKDETSEEAAKMRQLEQEALEILKTI